MSGMKVIKPTMITDAMLVSSTVPEPDASAGEVLWSPDVTYQVNDQVIRVTTHLKYLRTTSGKTSAAPENDSANWKATEPTNRWGAFDRKVGTASTAPATLTNVLRPGGVSGIGMLELAGRQVLVQMTSAPGGPVVYEKTVDLDGTVITSVYDWLFADYEQLTDFVLTDLPQHYPSCELKVQLSGTSGVSAGVIQVGQVLEAGSTLRGATVGIIDYSPKQKDDFGNWDVIERNYSKHCTLQVLTAQADFNKLYRRLASLRATPCIYIGTDRPGFEPMLVYGYYKDFGITVNYDDYHLLNIEIEGL